MNKEDKEWKSWQKEEQQIMCAGTGNKFEKSDFDEWKYILIIWQENRREWNSEVDNDHTLITKHVRNIELV